MPKEYTVEQAVKAAKKTGEYGVSDEEMDEIFLHTLINDQAELIAMLMIMETYRPATLKKLTDEYFKKS